MEITKNEPIENKGNWNAKLSIENSQGFPTSIELNGFHSKEEALIALDEKEKEIMNSNSDPKKTFMMP